MTDGDRAGAGEGTGSDPAAAGAGPGVAATGHAAGPSPAVIPGSRQRRPKAWLGGWGTGPDPRGASRSSLTARP